MIFSLFTKIYDESFLLTYRICFADFVVDFQAERARVEERLDNVTDNPTTGRQHFWLDRLHARTLATLKDHAWRSAQLLELCRRAFVRLNETLFPTGPQPQGIHAL